MKNQEIKVKNQYNLNITRYIDSAEPEDSQDIDAHIHGGIPDKDIDKLNSYWEAFSSLKKELLKNVRAGFSQLIVEDIDIRRTIYANEEFEKYGNRLIDAFECWKKYATEKLKGLNSNVLAKEFINDLAEEILRDFESLSLISKYDVYQVLLAYWNEILGDDVSLIIAEKEGYGIARQTEDLTKEGKDDVLYLD